MSLMCVFVAQFPKSALKNILNGTVWKRSEENANSKVSVEHIAPVLGSGNYPGISLSCVGS